MTYTSKRTGTAAGGYNNVVCFDESEDGHILAGGDTFAMNETFDGGDSWWPANHRLYTGAVQVGGLLSVPLDSLMIAGFGTGGGNLTVGLGSVIEVGGQRATSWEMRNAQIGAFFGGTNPTWLPAGDSRPRACGRLFARNNGQTFVYAIPYQNGLWRSDNYFNTATRIVAPSAMNQKLQSVIVEPGGNRVLVGTWAYNEPTKQGAYLIDNPQGAGTDAATVVPLTGAPRTVLEFCVVGSNLYAACGWYGVYRVTGANWNTWTKINTSSSWPNATAGSSGQPYAVGIDGMAVGGDDVLFVSLVNPPILAGDPNNTSVMRCIGAENGTPGAWESLIGDSQYSNNVWGSGEPWWVTQSFASFAPNKGTGEMESIRVDPFDLTGNTVHMVGRAGGHQARNAMAAAGSVIWRPSVYGQTGTTTRMLLADPGRPNHIYTMNTDHVIVASGQDFAPGTVRKIKPGSAAGNAGTWCDVGPDGKLYAAFANRDQYRDDTPDPGPSVGEIWRYDGDPMNVAANSLGLQAATPARDKPGGLVVIGTAAEPTVIAGVIGRGIWRKAASGSTPGTTFANAGTWCIREISAMPTGSVLTRINTALAMDGCVGFGGRIPWNVLETGSSGNYIVTLLNQLVAMCRARGKMFKPRFMSGYHTPSFHRGASPLTIGGQTVPRPFDSAGVTNATYNAGWKALVTFLFDWARDVNAQYGEVVVPMIDLGMAPGYQYSELYFGPEVQGIRATDGLSAESFVDTNEELLLHALDTGQADGSDDVAAGIGLSGHGPIMTDYTELGGKCIAERLAEIGNAECGDFSPRFFMQANGWDIDGREWGQAAGPEAQLDAAVWPVDNNAGLQDRYPGARRTAANINTMFAQAISGVGMSPQPGSVYNEIYDPTFVVGPGADNLADAAALTALQNKMVEHLAKFTAPPQTGAWTKVLNESIFNPNPVRNHLYPTAKLVDGVTAFMIEPNLGIFRTLDEGLTWKGPGGSPASGVWWGGGTFLSMQADPNDADALYVCRTNGIWRVNDADLLATNPATSAVRITPATGPMTALYGMTVNRETGDVRAITAPTATLEARAYETLNPTAGTPTWTQISDLMFSAMAYSLNWITTDDPNGQIFTMAGGVYLTEDDGVTDPGTPGGVGSHMGGSRFSLIRSAVVS